MVLPSQVTSPPPAAVPRRRLRTVALVGIDGSGKTTQAHRLADDLAALGLPARYCRNAGGRRWFGRVATLFGRADGDRLLGRKAMLVVESVLRWLAILRTLLRRRVTGGLVVMDRYAVCQYASLRARGARPAAERRARLAYRWFPAPDVTFLLAVDPRVAYDRIEARGYDHEETAYLRAASAAYESLPEYGTFVVIDADGTPDEVSAAIRGALAVHLPDVIPPTSAPSETVPPAPPRPRLPALLAGTRALILAAGSLTVAAAALGYQLAEAL